MLAVYIDHIYLLLKAGSRVLTSSCLVRRFDGLGIGNYCHCLEHYSVRGVEFVVKKTVH